MSDINAQSTNINSDVKGPEVAEPGNNDNNGVNMQGAAASADGSVENGSGVAAPDMLSDEEFESYIDNILAGGESKSESIANQDQGDEGGGVEPEANPDEAKPEESGSDEAKPFRVFNDEQEYQSEIDRIFSKRHKDYKDLKSERDSIVDYLKEFYDTDNDSEAVELFKNQMIAKKSAEKGITAEEYSEQKETERKAKLYDEQQKQQNDVEQLRSRLFSEESEIKKSDSSFDLMSVYSSDKQFKSDLDDSGSVYLAYANYVKRAQKAPAKAVPAPAAANKPQRNFSEVGTKPSASGKVSTSPAELSDEDFEAYIKKIQGEY